VTRDFVNPERPWPHLGPLAAATAAAGKLLLPRLPVYPQYLLDLSAAGGPGGPAAASRWLSGEGGPASVGAAARRAADSSGLLRASGWCAGAAEGGAEGQGRGAEAQDRGAPHSGAAEAPAPEAPAVAAPPAAGGGSAAARQQPASPLPRPRPEALWRIAIGPDGTLEGAGAPGAPAPEVAALLERVLSGASASTSTSTSTSGGWNAGKGGSSGAARQPPGGGGGGSPAEAPRGDAPAASEVGTGLELSEAEIALLLRARGPDFRAVVAAADELRRRVCGDEVTYVVNRWGACRWAVGPGAPMPSRLLPQTLGCRTAAGQ
jgi:hypothetical protein